jgi:hypothetical protein
MTMPLSVLEVPKEVAVAGLKSYRAAVRVSRRAEDRRVAAGYYHITKGRQVIALGPTIAAGGMDERGRPRLAVCRADARTCWLRLAEGGVTFMSQPWRSFYDRGGEGGVSTHGVRVRLAGAKWVSTEWQAIVPMVPPEHRQSAKLAFHILWEANWTQAAPRDPALIRHLGGDLWAVYGVWDLTEIERAVLAGRAR